MKKSVYIVLAFILVLGLTACDGTKKRWVVWFETYCDDPWLDQGNQNAAIRDFLNNEGIEVFNMQKKVGLTLPQQCSECNCRNGNVFRVKIKDEDTEKAVSLGFYPD